MLAITLLLAMFLASQTDLSLHLVQMNAAWSDLQITSRKMNIRLTLRLTQKLLMLAAS